MTIKGVVLPSKVNREVAGLRTEATEGPVLPTYTVATLPAADENDGRFVHCSDGAAGSPCLAFSDGTDWLRVTLGAAVAAA